MFRYSTELAGWARRREQLTLCIICFDKILGEPWRCVLCHGYAHGGCIEAQRKYKCKDCVAESTD